MCVCVYNHKCTKHNVSIVSCHFYCTVRVMVKSMLIILSIVLVRCPVYINANGTMDKCPDYQGVLISEV